jgi:hypothetical protein
MLYNWLQVMSEARNYLIQAYGAAQVNEDDEAAGLAGHIFAPVNISKLRQR